MSWTYERGISIRASLRQDGEGPVDCRVWARPIRLRDLATR